MTNFLNDNDPVHDKSSVWRGIILVFVIVIAIGALVFSRLDFSMANFVFVSKIIEPLEVVIESGDNIGGDIQILPPKQIKPKLPELVGEMLDPNQFTANSIIIKDQKTGAVLYHKNEYQSRPIASITKLMSALVLLEKNLNWSATTTVIGADLLGTHMYAGDVYTLEDLWLAALVGSSNKAILSLANALDWPVEAFVERMNQKALELGMTETYFTDPTGLDDTNISSASDVAILLNEALSWEEISRVLLIPEHNLYAKERGKNHHIWNTDWLLLGWIPHNFVDFRGGKTGYIPAAGYNFTMQVGNEAGNIINVVVLGVNSHEGRFTEARDMANWVFANYVWY